MGLDMYLYKASNNGDYDWNNDEIAYWRKANQIHAWFVNNVQDGIDECQESVVTKDDIQKLLSICNMILFNTELTDGEINNGYTLDANGNMIPIKEKGKIIINPSVAEKLLPTEGGFFFGSTDYDEYYIADIRYTVDVLNKVLNEFDFENNKLIYSSSW